MNFHSQNGIYFRREGDDLLIVKATSFDEPGELLARLDINTFASVVSSFSPHNEGNHSFQYALEFLKDGVMYCGGCGAKLTPEKPGIGRLSIVDFPSCTACYEQKFKPMFDWGMKSS